MIEIKVFGSTPPCAKCKEAEKRATRVAEKYPGKVTVTKVDAISEEGGKYGVMFTPTLVLNDKVIAAGKIISEGELEDAINAALEGQA